MEQKKTIGITGANGALGKALIRRFKQEGYNIIGFSHKKRNEDSPKDQPNKWIYWKCGEEVSLKKALEEIDILILNHGIYEANIRNQNFEKTIEINSISKLRIIELFEDIVFNQKNLPFAKEIWINTSEAELFPALSPSYEVSKSLIGQIISFKKNLYSKSERKKLIIRKIVLGPFKSELNPIGIMNAYYVAWLICFISKFNIRLIIISINPFTYLFFPLKELYYFCYSLVLKIIQ